MPSAYLPLDFIYRVIEGFRLLRLKARRPLKLSEYAAPEKGSYGTTQGPPAKTKRKIDPTTESIATHVVAPTV